VRVSNTYDNADHLLLLANLNSTGTTLSSFNYAYNGVGNRTRVQEVDGSVLTWSYDPTYQLTNEQRSGANSYNITYTYDATGNRTLMVNNGAPTTYAYNAANELATSQTSAGVTTYTSDGDGNLLTSLAPGNQLTTNTWNGENRLTQVALPSATTDIFTYNGDGLRVQKQDSTGTTKHVWDGQNMLVETNSSNIVQVVYTLEPVLYGNLISQSRGGTDSFYIFDALGSTRQLASSAGSVTDSYLYDSLGDGLLTTGATLNWFRYIGRIGYYFDNDLAKYSARARIFDPSTGRFISRDPFDSPLASTQLYAYADNNPLRYVDPTGKLTVVPLHKDFNTPCGGEAKIYWDFRLDHKEHCEGYIVQQVDIRCNFIACKGNCECPTTSPTQPTLTFWEAWYVKKDEPLYYLRQEGKINYTDASIWPVPQNTCGTISAVGTIRFYSIDRTHDLGRTGMQAPFSGWKIDGRYVVGNCGGYAGKLPSTDDKKLVEFFWGFPPLESASRSSSNYWNCCGQDNFVRPSANPE